MTESATSLMSAPLPGSSADSALGGSGAFPRLPMAAALAGLCVSFSSAANEVIDTSARYLVSPSEWSGATTTEFVGKIDSWSGIATSRPDRRLRVYRSGHNRSDRGSVQAAHTTANLIQSEWAGLFSDVGRWRLLPHGWDGDEGSSPSEMTVEAAKAIATRLHRAGIRRPEHFLASDGEISFDWSAEGRRASISIDQAGTIVAYCEQGGSRPFLEIEADHYDRADWETLFNGLRSFA